ncbi:MAG TPA: rhodanese-like domain-containing protein [Candidatus Paceibacterota bacterium]|nr:rhodanese-like domain-containing protein [Candidatus Paceibacterota bacterium]HRZ54243.1 rhodanese-like domain-containing protein [Candidatus Paceibacterota bacterium]
MKADFPRLPARARRLRVGDVLREGVLVAIVGAAIAFAANAVSPRGLVLARNYFPTAVQVAGPAPAASPAQPGPAETNAVGAAPAPPVAESLDAESLQRADIDQAAALFRDPRYQAELVVFIDARDEAQYREGHVPGAYQFDHYRPEKQLATVLHVCQLAEQIVVYCTGGDCEDSEFAALALIGVGIPKERFFIYVGGMSEWAAQGLPVEIGERNSGNIGNAEP